MVARSVVEDQRQVVERDDGMEVIGENLEELGHRLVARKCLRDAQQRVVAREMGRRERFSFCHVWKTPPQIRHLAIPASWRQARRAMSTSTSSRPSHPLNRAKSLSFIGREHKPIHVGNRGDLTVDERRRSTQPFKSRPFLAVPGRRSLVVRQDQK